MATEFTTVIELIRLILTSYLTIAIMGIGFAVMFAGSQGASAAARFFFARPMQWVVHTIGMAVLAGLGLLWSGAARVGKKLAGEFKEFAADLRWLIAGR